MTTERWKPVVGYETSYEVSDQGRVRSIDRVIHRKQWDRNNNTMTSTDYHYRGRLLKPAPTRSGHMMVLLGRGHNKQVHTLILEAFVGPRPKNQEACHSDDNPSHNTLDNLGWGTRSKNLLDAVRNGKKAVGQKVKNAKLIEKDIPSIRLQSIGPRGSIAALARKYNVCDATIRQVRDNKSWKAFR